jgi:hypothetical protein
MELFAYLLAGFLFGGAVGYVAGVKQGGKKNSIPSGSKSGPVEQPK